MRVALSTPSRSISQQCCVLDYPVVYPKFPNASWSEASFPLTDVSLGQVDQFYASDDYLLFISFGLWQIS